MSDLDVQVRSMLAEAGINEEGSDELVRLLAGLDARYVDGAAPEPGPELAALLGRGDAPFGRPPRPRGRRAAATGLVALGVVVSTGWAAAANELPPPAQRWVADFSQRYLHLELPYPQPVTPAGAPKPTSERKDGSRWVDAHDARPVAERDAGSSSTPRRHDASGDDSDVDERYSGDSETDYGEEAETEVRDEREDATQESGQEAEEDSESETPTPTRKSAEDSETEDMESSDGSESDDGFAEPASDAAEESSDD